MDCALSGILVSREAVEASLGARLRLDQYRHCFADDAVAKQLSERLSEGQPSFKVTPLTLRQWYTRYHPASGPLQYESAKELDDAMGDHLRTVYPNFTPYALRTALSQRRKTVLVSVKTARTWCNVYASASSASADPAPQVLKRPAAHLSRALKRPAAASCALKRPAAADWQESSCKKVSLQVLQDASSVDHYPFYHRKICCQAAAVLPRL